MLPELRIFVDKIGEKQYKSRLTDMTNGQVVGTNTFTYDPELLVHSEPQTYLEKGVPRHEFEAVRAGLHPPAGSETCGRVSDPIAAFGQRLFSYLVGNRAAWEGFLRFSPAFQGQARLNIALDPQAAVLWSVPWEYLHDGSSFLALQGRWQIVRLPWALPEVTPGPAPLPLRVLVVIASPKDQAELNVEREIELIQEALDEAQGSGVVKVDFMEFATLDDLREALTGQSYQVLHFTGHGSWNAAEQRNSLAFEDDEGQTDHVTPDELCPLVVGKGLLLAVLSSCLGARTGSRDAFIGMGTALLRAGVPVVLAMQSSILDESGIALGRAFYTALGRGLSVEEALQQVRLALWQRPGQRLGAARPLPAHSRTAPDRPAGAGRGQARTAAQRGRPAAAAGLCGAQGGAAGHPPGGAGAGWARGLPLRLRLGAGRGGQDGPGGQGPGQAGPAPGRLGGGGLPP